MTSPTVATQRVIIVVTKAHRALSNDTLRNVDPSAPADAINVALRLTSQPQTATTIDEMHAEATAYGTPWNLDDAQAVRLRQAVRDAGWRATQSELAVRTITDEVPAWGSQRVYLFDGNPGQWVWDSVLATLGLTGFSLGD